VGMALTACNNNYKIATDSAGNSANSQSTSNNPSNPNDPPVSGCVVQNVSQNLRILFMVDDSGSTATTDPNNANRVTTIDTFLNTYASKSNLTYSYNYFGTNAASFNMASDTFVSSVPSSVFGTADDARAALTAFKNLKGTAGNTNYSSAFSRIQSIIQNDLASNSNESYVVIFMSDGQPTDQGSSAVNQINGITSLSSSLMGLAASGRITLSTVYFGPSDAQAQNNLQTMAALGGGQFINTNVTTQYSIDNLINVPVQACN
jgi:Mg-chelatase subunit ChlD